MGKIKIKQPQVRGQVMSLMYLSDIIMLCHVSVYSGTFGNLFFEYKNAVLSGEQKKELFM